MPIVSSIIVVVGSFKTNHMTSDEILNESSFILLQVFSQQFDVEPTLKVKLLNNLNGKKMVATERTTGSLGIFTN